ncbi:unnamed protein product [Paramecium octaurelia]|uniref:Uncharacterized protein n=1 Tax=Paramecium octaurelia TaxID=43137 RepID=A0A8S1XTR8_PAROT|nr:unnamed protein product [Paramecium octaurelia]
MHYFVKLFRIFQVFPQCLIFLNPPEVTSKILEVPLIAINQGEISLQNPQFTSNRLSFHKQQPFNFNLHNYHINYPFDLLMIFECKNYCYQGIHTKNGKIIIKRYFWNLIKKQILQKKIYLY